MKSNLPTLLIEQNESSAAAFTGALVGSLISTLLQGDRHDQADELELIKQQNALLQQQNAALTQALGQLLKGQQSSPSTAIVPRRR